MRRGSRTLRGSVHLRQRCACTDQWGLSQTPLGNPPSSLALPQLSRKLGIQIPYPIANNVITRTSSLQMLHGIANHVITETFSFQIPYRIEKHMTTHAFSIRISQYIANTIITQTSGFKTQPNAAYVIKRILGFETPNFPAKHAVIMRSFQFHENRTVRTKYFRIPPLFGKGTEEVPYQRVLVEGAGSRSGVPRSAEVPELRTPHGQGRHPLTNPLPLAV